MSSPLEAFLKRIPDLPEKKPSELIDYFLYYLTVILGQDASTAKEIDTCFDEVNCLKYSNTSTYLSRNAKRAQGKVPKFIRSSNGYKIERATEAQLKESLVQTEESEEVISDSSVLPEILFDNLRRPYLLRTVKQINASYEANLFDATALLMRRLLEILLIHAFQTAGLESEVQDPAGNFQPLKGLINKASSRPEITLSPSVARSMDQFRELGNLSAHLIHYNCRRDDIRHLRMDYRSVIEELLFHCGFTGS